jgi:hypothetical protein
MVILMKLVTFTTNKNKYNIIMNLLNFFLKIHLNFTLFGIQLLFVFFCWIFWIIGLIFGLNLTFRHLIDFSAYIIISIIVMFLLSFFLVESFYFLYLFYFLFNSNILTLVWIVDLRFLSDVIFRTNSKFFGWLKLKLC